MCNAITCIRKSGFPYRYLVPVQVLHHHFFGPQLESAKTVAKICQNGGYNMQTSVEDIEGVVGRPARTLANERNSEHNSKILSFFMFLN